MTKAQVKSYLSLEKQLNELNEAYEYIDEEHKRKYELQCDEIEGTLDEIFTHLVDYCGNSENALQMINEESLLTSSCKDSNVKQKEN